MFSDDLKQQYSQVRVAAIFALITTGLPVLGLIKQLIQPTGDLIVIQVVGVIVTVFFLCSILLFYSLKKIQNLEKRYIWSKYQYIIGIVFILYPFVGLLPAILLIKSGKLGMLSTDLSAK